jgi:nicotinate-nucleotide adenylyltransferase
LGLDGCLPIGLMGGTFDPIHLAHLVMAEAAHEQFGLWKVIFVPAGLPPHKQGKNITSAEHRYNMVALATAANPRFEVSRIELEREGPSYTVDTVEEMRRRLSPETEIHFITGADAILEVETWREPERLFGACRFVAAPRSSYPRQAAGVGLRRLEQRYGQAILEVESPVLDISSSNLRRRVAAGRSIKYLVPEAVEAYIQKHGLYRP